MGTRFEAWFDGACWPNPNGHAACGAVVKLGTEVVFEHSEYIGTENTSNNVAEYCGMIAILEFLKKAGKCEAIIYGDSDLTIKQITGVWKAGKLSKKEASGKIPIKPRYYFPFYQKARALLDEQRNSHIEFQWIPRAENEEADALSTKPLRDRGFRETYYRTSPHDVDSLDEAFERAISE
jgi:ribonuclease HI